MYTEVVMHMHVYMCLACGYGWSLGTRLKTNMLMQYIYAVC